MSMSETRERESRESCPLTETSDILSEMGSDDLERLLVDDEDD